MTDARESHTTTEREPFIVHCGTCSHEWTAFYMPIDGDKLALFSKIACPVCAGSRVFCGRAEVAA